MPGGTCGLLSQHVHQPTQGGFRCLLRTICFVKNGGIPQFMAIFMGSMMIVHGFLGQLHHSQANSKVLMLA